MKVLAILDAIVPGDNKWVLLGCASLPFLCVIIAMLLVPFIEYNF